MKIKIFILLTIILFTLAIPFVSADTNHSEFANYDYLSSHGEKIILPFGEGFLIYPEETFFGNSYEIILGIKINKTSTDSKKDIALTGMSYDVQPIVWAETTDDESSFLIYQWNVDIWDVENPSLIIYQDESIIYKNNFLFKSEKRPVMKKEILNSETINLSLEKNDEDELNKARTELYVEGLKYSKLEFEQMNKKALNNYAVEKHIETIKETYENNETKIKTKVTIILNKISDEKTSVDIIEFIPKDIVSEARMIDSNPRFSVIKEDPVIMWHITETDKNISYEINDDVKATGNTILISQLTSESETESFPWKTLAPILLIPLIAGIIVFFGRFEPKTKK